jgi:LuxR family transcriptional regulator, maltose regulon positive regulatory protein
MELIVEKIVSPLELPRVSRKRLLKLLAQNLTCFGATVLSGRAGTGKTLLATDFARHCRRRVAWYKVEAPDADPRSFVRYLAASINIQYPGFAKSIPELETGPFDEANLPNLVNAFAYPLEQCNSLLLVLDDLHLVYDSEWVVSFLSRLLTFTSPERHVLLLARSLPPAPLWRLRSKQALDVIEEAALAFTPSEAEELFAGYGRSAAEAGQAWEQTHGRAAALGALAPHPPLPLLESPLHAVGW